MTFPASVPEIPAANVKQAVAYYVNNLGFTLDWGGEQGGIAGISRGNCRLFITNASFREPHGNVGPILFWLNLESKAEVDDLFTQWRATQAMIVSEPEDKPWKLREFIAADLDGNLIRVFHDFNQATGPAIPQLKTALPMVFVSNVSVAAAFFRDKLGFTIDFLHGDPPFYGSVSRGGARLHLRFVHEPPIAPQLREQEKLLSAVLEVTNIKILFAEYKKAGVTFAQPLQTEPWGASGFTVSDPDGNSIYFAGER
jgi:uncharacterized glyoxalase superfamily protein PhnB